MTRHQGRNDRRRFGNGLVLVWAIGAAERIADEFMNGRSRRSLARKYRVPIATIDAALRWVLPRGDR